MMYGRAKGNFLVLSGLAVAFFVGLVSLGAWELRGGTEEPPKPQIVGSAFKPAIVGPELHSEKVDAAVVAKNVGANKGVRDDVEPPRHADAPAPAAIARSGEKGRWIYIDKAGFRLYLAEGNKVIDSWGVALGKVTGNKAKAGDMRTPEGNFSVQQIQDASSWTHDFKDGKGVIKNAYGPWFIRLKTGWKGIGIHGTHDPDSIGTLASEGCIRRRNEDLRKLKPLVAKGMKVVIASNAAGDKEDAKGAKGASEKGAKEKNSLKSGKKK